MKLSRQTIDILHWCSTIQKDLVIQPGNRVRTISISKSTLLEATVAETFPSTCALHSISRMLDYINDATDISFSNPTYLELRNGRTLTRVPKVSERLVIGPPAKGINIQNFEESFFLHSDDAYELRCLSGKDTVVEVYASKQGDNIRIDHFEKSLDKTCPVEPLIHTMELVKPQRSNQQFRCRFKLPDLNLWQGSYQVDISSAGVGKFSWLNSDVVVYIALQAQHSSFTAKAVSAETTKTVAAKGTAE